MTHARPTTVIEAAALSLPAVQSLYHPFVLPAQQLVDGVAPVVDWVDILEMDTVQEMVRVRGPDKVRVLVLYGSLRER